MGFACKFTRLIKLNPSNTICTTIFITRHILFGKHALPTGIAICFICLQLEVVGILVINLVFTMLTIVGCTLLLSVASTSVAVGACHSCYKGGGLLQIGRG